MQEGNISPDGLAATEAMHQANKAIIEMGIAIAGAELAQIEAADNLEAFNRPDRLYAAGDLTLEITEAGQALIDQLRAAAEAEAAERVKRMPTVDTTPADAVGLEPYPPPWRQEIAGNTTLEDASTWQYTAAEPIGLETAPTAKPLPPDMLEPRPPNAPGSAKQRQRRRRARQQARASRKANRRK